jgi:hypothetical protein
VTQKRTTQNGLVAVGWSCWIGGVRYGVAQNTPLPLNGREWFQLERSESTRQAHEGGMIT